VARCLIVGCGCRGRLLSRALVERGHVVRGTTRDGARSQAIESAGAEAVLADPDRVGTLVPALEHVTVVCHLLGSATGPSPQLEALHGSRLEMLLSRLIDTTVQGVLYESRGTTDSAILGGGAELVAAFAQRTHSRWAALEADPAEPGGWLEAALAQVGELLGPG
jgi:hypothetical protein